MLNDFQGRSPPNRCTTCGHARPVGQRCRHCRHRHRPGRVDAGRITGLLVLVMAGVYLYPRTKARPSGGHDGIPAYVTAPATGATPRGVAEAPVSPLPPSAQDRWLKNNFDVAYDICSHDPEGLFKQAGTRDRHRAAEWLSQGMREGPHRSASYRGCFAALTGQPKVW